MALPHAQLLDIIDVSPLQGKLPESVSKSLIKTNRLQLLHLVLRQDQEFPLHHVADESVLHCLEGAVELVFPGGIRALSPGQLVVLPAAQVHALRASSDSTVLVSLLLQDGDAGDLGGTDKAA